MPASSPPSRKPVHGETRYLALLAGALMMCVVFSAQAAPEATFEFQSMFGKQGFYQSKNIPPTGFTAPTGVTWLHDGRIVVADRGNSKLQLCAVDGTCSWIGNDVAGFRNTPGTFDLPYGVQANSQGLIGIADEDNHAIQLCTLDDICEYSGVTTSENNPPSVGLGRWAYPRDVAFDSTDRVYGLDSGNSRIQILNATNLNFIKVFGQLGTALGQYDTPRGIAMDEQDRVIVSDTGNNRVQICDNVGKNCSAFGSLGSGVGQFNGPIGIDVDQLGRIWVADTGNNRIQVCDYSGSCVAFGSGGSGAGKFDMPSDVSVSPDGQVAVVDTNNNRIEFFATEAAFQINAGMNDAWYNTATPGQGFFMTVYPDLKKVFIANFTFDTVVPDASVTAQLGDPSQRWLTAYGDYSGNRATLDVELTSGGIFDASDPAPTQTEGYGTFILEFSDCNNGTITYDIPSLGLQGVIPITRVASDNIALCEALSQP